MVGPFKPPFVSAYCIRVDFEPVGDNLFFIYLDALHKFTLSGHSDDSDLQIEI